MACPGGTALALVGAGAVGFEALGWDTVVMLGTSVAPGVRVMASGVVRTVVAVRLGVGVSVLVTVVGESCAEAKEGV